MSFDTFVNFMLEENRRRDELMKTVIQSLNRNQGVNEWQNYQVMPDLSKNIEYFHGHETSGRAKEWLENLESMKVLHRWLDNFALETAQMHLKEGAREWYISRRSVMDTWRSFQNFFRVTYIREESKTARW